MSRRYVPARMIADGADPVSLTAADAGWTYCGLRVLALAPGEERSFSTGDAELFVLPLSTTGVVVVAGGETFTVHGRTSVFARVTDFVYVGRDTDVTISSTSGGEVALPSATCDRRLAPRYGAAEDVGVETRGAGGATRQVTNFASPEAWSHAVKLMCVELLTPDGNWSSYPPHKHDDSPECPVANEEVYYFRIATAGTTECTPSGFGVHRTYTGDGAVDDNLVVHDGDVYLIPRGYHGPCVAAPGYTMYYLNVLAGPGVERSMAFCDDPAHHWVRDSWDGMPTDPRCPMTGADGVVAAPPGASLTVRDMPTSSTFVARLAGAPISWGICEVPGWGLQLPVDRVLAEARALGITAMEQGALGWLPTDPAAQRAKLDEYGLHLIGGFVPLVLHDPAGSSEMLARANRIATNMAAAGGSFFVTAAVGSLTDWFRPVMTEASWGELFANLARVDEICAGHGLTQVVHPHVDTLIETAAELERFLARCTARLCLDTGHLTIGGVDVVAVARQYPDRIALVHLKDVDGGVAARARSGELDLMAATQAGLFPSLGDGMVRIAEVVATLEAAGYDGWYVLENDVALTGGEPPIGEGPDRGVARSLAFLRSLELAGTGP